MEFTFTCWGTLREQTGNKSEGASSMQAFRKPSIDWFAVFIPISFLLAYVPSLKNEAALFVCTCLAMVVVSA